MSRKRRNRAQRGHLVEGRRDHAKEQEILNSEIFKDPSVKEMLSKWDGTELEFIQTVLQLQKIARGSASILESPELADIENKMKEEAAKRDAAAAAFEADQQGFIDGLFNRGERIKKTGTEAQRIRENSSNAMAIAVQNARITQKHRRAKLEEFIKNSPTETIVVTGVNTLLGGSRHGQWAVLPEEIKIGHLTWTLSPGQHEVPRPVAEEFRRRQKEKMEGMERKRVLSAMGEDRAVAQGWANINKKYNSGGDNFVPG